MIARLAEYRYGGLLFIGQRYLGCLDGLQQSHADRSQFHLRRLHGVQHPLVDQHAADLLAGAAEDAAFSNCILARKIGADQ